MDQNNIRIEHIRVSDLPDFANRVINDSETGQFVPITLQRAIAHANNPMASGDDVGLLAAIDDDGVVVGYFGILPILLRVRTDSYKAHWFTTWSVSSKVRGMGVGSRLMAEALSLKLDYLIVGSIHARRVCQKYGFWEREPLIYYWIDLSALGTLNPIKMGLRMIRKTLHIIKVKKTIPINSPITKHIDNFLSPITKKITFSILGWVYDKVINDFQFAEVSEVREFEPRKNDLSKTDLHRGSATINWMLKYPWVLEDGQSPTEWMDYFFSDTRSLFKFIPIEIFTREDGKYLGFVIFSVSQKLDSISIKTLDFHVDDPRCFEIILALVIKYARNFNVDIVEIPEIIANAFNPFGLSKILLHGKERIYQCFPSSEDSPLAKAWDDIEFHLYDGDMAFS